MSPKKVVITGSRGNVGSLLADFLARSGCQITGLVHGPGEGQYLLGDEIDEKVYEGHDAFIHCSYDFSARNVDEIRKRNVEGSLKLFKAAKRAGVTKLVLISTVSAYEGCPSFYGRGKLELEKKASVLGVDVIRLGLLYGKQTGKSFDQFEKMAKKLGFIPLIGLGNTKILTTHSDDLCNLVQRILASDGSEIIEAYSDQSITVRQAIRTEMRKRGVRPFFAPIPPAILYGGLRVLESIPAIRKKIRTRSDMIRVLTDDHPPRTNKRSSEMVFQSFDRGVPAR